AGSNVVLSRQSAKRIPASRRARATTAIPCPAAPPGRSPSAATAPTPHGDRATRPRPPAPTTNAARVLPAAVSAPPPLPPPGAVLPRHRPEVRGDLTGAREPGDVVERRHERHRHHRADAGRRGEAPRHPIGHQQPRERGRTPAWDPDPLAAQQGPNH